MSRAESHLRWQAARRAELAGPDSWLGLIGLFWLEPGLNSVGSQAGSVVELPLGPACLGYLNWQGEQLFWQPEGGAVIALKSDRDGQPSVLEHAHLSFFVVDRDGRLAVRLRDRDWAAGRPAPELAYFDYAEGWSVEARWQPLAEALSMEVPNVCGELKPVTVTHRADFEVAGQTVSLLPMSVSESEVFFVFRDRTSGKESYGAGRFLKVPAPTDGTIRLDFNFAYSPPCAFTPFATCPLPPPENWLPFAVTAGEQKPLGK